jgi:hypothetical protein
MTGFPFHVIFQTVRLRVRSFPGRYHGETLNDASGQTTTGCLLKWRRNKLPNYVMCKIIIYILTDICLLNYLLTHSRTYLLTCLITHLLSY